MAEPTLPKPPPPLPPPPQQTAEEAAAVKSDTDCVYFLASPLTCKKGSECEYRHSDMARLNPRDCWYWLNGNCLNPKCAFRHPPLDGILEAQVPTAMGFSVAPMVPAGSMLQVPYASSKQSVPCIFFQQGICRNGDKCSFMHAPNFVSDKPTPPLVSTASSEPETVKAFGGSLQDEELAQENIPKPKPPGKLEIRLSKKSNNFDEVLPPNSVRNSEHPRYKPSMPPTKENPLGGPNRMQQPPLETDGHRQFNDVEISREPSPALNVLAEEEQRGSDYYGGGDSAEYDSVADNDREVYRDVRRRRYGSSDRLQDRYAKEQRIASSERIPGGSSAHLERRRYGRVDSPERVERSDLRHRLSKHRRGANGLKSAVGHDFSSEKHVEDRSNKSSRRDTRYLPSHDRSVSDRLRGRIKLPGRSSSPGDRAGLRLDRGRDHGRLSSERPQPYSYHGRPRDRIKGRLQEDHTTDDRNNRVRRPRRDTINDNDSAFRGPKSLEELKGRKTAESNEQGQPLGKRKFQKVDSREDVSFEGPMPLKEILKRKRAGGSEDDQCEREHQTEKTSATGGSVDFPSAVPMNVSDLPIPKEESKLVSGDSADHQSPFRHNASEPEAEGEMDAQDNDEGYEPVEGEYYNFEELYEDEDDFAKKLGVSSP